jgi:hypothetical protein
MSRSRRPDTARIPHAFALLLLTMLAGCLPDKSKDLALCRREADRFFQASIADDPSSPKSDFIIGCMAEKGYDFTVVPRDCDSRYPFPTQSACYSPNDWLEWTVDRLKAAYRSTSHAD